MHKGSWFLAVFLLFAASAFAQLPDSPGKAETEKVCKQCHELARSVSLHQDRDGWRATVDKMVNLGAKASEKDLQAIFEYLVKNYPAEEIPKINVNKAESIELESGLALRRSQAKALIEYRTKNGDFKSIEDLKKVPGLDAGKITEKKDRIVF